METLRTHSYEVKLLPNKCDKTINVNNDVMCNKTQDQRVQEGTNILKMVFGKKQELAIAA